MDVKNICNKCEKTLIDTTNIAMEKAKTFKVFDFAMMKVCLFSMGALIGAKCSKFFKKFAPFFIIVTLASYAYLVYKLFFEDEN